jgi:hypothetical protein
VSLLPHGHYPRAWPTPSSFYVRRVRAYHGLPPKGPVKKEVLLRMSRAEQWSLSRMTWRMTLHLPQRYTTRWWMTYWERLSLIATAGMALIVAMGALGGRK